MLDGIPKKLRPVIKMLRDGFEYSVAEKNRWLFAVEIHQLLSEHVTPSDLRWLALCGVVEHAKEITLPGAEEREFQSTGRLTFSPETCFVLSDYGIVLARSFEVDSCGEANALASSQTENGVPNWDADRRELWLAGMMVKQFRWQAINQERVLSAFQEDGWPPVIDDPLTQKPEVDPKRRLHDTIKCLNRGHKHKLLSFHGNGDGESVRWERVDLVDRSISFKADQSKLNGVSRVAPPDVP